MARRGCIWFRACHAGWWFSSLVLFMQCVFGMSSASAGNASETLWSRLVAQPAVVPEHLVVIGTVKNGAFAPSEVVLPEPLVVKSHARSFPLETNLLPMLDIQPFGVEERLTVSRNGGDVVLTCAAGGKPAGVVLKAPGLRLPMAMRGALVVEGRGSSGLGFALTPPGQDATERPISSAPPLLASISSYEWPRGEAASQLVVTCPTTAATATIGAIRLAPHGHSSGAAIGTWLWDQHPWRDNVEELIAIARKNGVRDLFLQIHIENGAVADSEKLIGLLKTLSAAGIKMHAVEGDADMTGAEGRMHALWRARILRDFAMTSGLVQSFQYDIEPYLRADFSADPVSGWRQWATTITNLAETLGEKVSVVVPFWMLDSDGGDQALQTAKGSISEVTVMAYRTDPAEVEQITEPWFGWGDSHALPISVALENGPLPLEYNRTYFRANRGDLVFDRSGQVTMVRSLSAPVTASRSRPTYSFAHEVPADRSRVSFLNDRQALTKASERLGRTLSAWTSFRRLMIHGLIGPRASNSAEHDRWMAQKQRF
jgi:hypothetical protein